jgi:hypothetical protein
MTGNDKEVYCDVCKQGRVTKHWEEIVFRQWSDKGYVHCRVTVLVGLCEQCGAKSLDATSKILDEVFQREYDKLPWQGPRP